MRLKRRQPSSRPFADWVFSFLGRNTNARTNAMRRRIRRSGRAPTGPLRRAAGAPRRNRGILSARREPAQGLALVASCWIVGRGRSGATTRMLGIRESWMVCAVGPDRDGGQCHGGGYPASLNTGERHLYRDACPLRTLNEPVPAGHAHVPRPGAFYCSLGSLP